MEKKLTCPHCQMPVTADPNLIDARMHCPHCGGTVAIPGIGHGGADAHPGKPPGRPGWGLGLGIAGMLAWLLPVLGLPITLVGLVFSVNALKRPEKGLALAGTILCGLGLGLTILNAAMGFFFGGLEPADGPTINVPGRTAIGLEKHELSLSTVTVYANWQESDVLVDDSMSSSGSAGVLAERNGNLHLVTNRHCLILDELFNADADGPPEVISYDLVVVFPSGMKRSVERIGVQTDNVDIAILVLDAKGLKEGRDFVFLPFDESARIDQGAEVVAVGSPSGLTGTQTFGRISAIRDAQVGSARYHLIQVDAAINAGNSGGPLFLRHLDRYVCIGFNTFIIRDAESLGFAISSSILTPDRFEWYDISDL